VSEQQKSFALGDILGEFVELNPANYDSTDVEELQGWAFSAYDEIERLRAEVERLKATTVPVIWSHCHFDGPHPAGFESWHDWICRRQYRDVYVHAMYPSGSSAADKADTSQGKCIPCECHGPAGLGANWRCVLEKPAERTEG
jgi:hypothetical protein